jgi:hypothetical protein
MARAIRGSLLSEVARGFSIGKSRFLVQILARIMIKAPRMTNPNLKSMAPMSSSDGISPAKVLKRFINLEVDTNRPAPMSTRPTKILSLGIVILAFPDFY